MYNKEALLTALLNKTLPETFAHIRGLKDVRQLKLTVNPDYRDDLDVEGALAPQFRCPITQLDFNGIHPFVVIWSTGHVLSDSAIRSIGTAALNSEYGPFTEDDIIR